ncbi:Undecaprenyl-phosphate alpha-N-acetylglucosaminyl 1-phosphate transferase [Rickettsiales bacterium Ac37b]|nr:Undecaprenyl-phosphate alpha-N-acetylglucosaminyl 1-phosphate transferase [Rickettsiales bacterium Ac37b]
MSINYYLICISIIVFILSYFGTKYMVQLMPKLKIMAIPESRSNHMLPTPVGGGVAIISSTIIGLCLLSTIIQIDVYVIQIILLSLPLVLISFIDDVKNISIFIRLVLHITVSICAIMLIPSNNLIFNGLFPYTTDRIFASLLLAWFINCYNFMDGIDGMAGCETIHISISILLLNLITHTLSISFNYLNVFIILSSCGFLIWNWHPARIFMGDTGSITLGFILGCTLLHIASKGLFLQALLIPLYYILDAGITMVRRLITKQNIFKAHSEHFFQQAVRRGLSHATVVKKVILLNLVLLLLTLISVIIKL